MILLFRIGYIICLLGLVYIAYSAYVNGFKDITIVTTVITFLVIISSVKFMFK